MIQTPASQRGSVRIAAAQYPIDRFATLGAYEDKLARWVGEAAGAGAELLVFPEYGAMELAGPMGGAVADLAASLRFVSAATARIDACHADLARRHQLHILAASGPSERGEQHFVNAARLFAPSGASGVQDKQIMTPFEVDWGISGGNGLSVFETALGCIGIAICYDSEFPLLVRALGEAGAGIVLIPACTEFASGHNRLRTAALARALENGIVTAISPTIGDASWSPSVDRNFGAAGIFVPAEQGLSDTGVLAIGETNRPGWVHAMADLAHLARVRNSGEMRNAADWPRQAGAVPLGANVRRVMLA